MLHTVSVQVVSFDTTTFHALNLLRPSGGMHAFFFVFFWHKAANGLVNQVFQPASLIDLGSGAGLICVLHALFKRRKKEPSGLWRELPSQEVTRLSGRAHGTLAQAQL